MNEIVQDDQASHFFANPPDVGLCSSACFESSILQAICF